MLTKHRGSALTCALNSFTAAVHVSAGSPVWRKTLEYQRVLSTTIVHSRPSDPGAPH